MANGAGFTTFFPPGGIFVCPPFDPGLAFHMVKFQPTQQSSQVGGLSKGRHKGGLGRFL